MQTSQFEGCKVALKQDKTGYILTLSIHPNDVPEEILRDFVGARYQVVMVRLNGQEKPMVREHEVPDVTQQAGILCRDKDFQLFLSETGEIFDESEASAVSWMCSEFDIKSRTELRSNEVARAKFNKWKERFYLWKNQS